MGGTFAKNLDFFRQMGWALLSSQAALVLALAWQAMFTEVWYEWGIGFSYMVYTALGTVQVLVGGVILYLLFWKRNLYGFPTVREFVFLGLLIPMANIVFENFSRLYAFNLHLVLPVVFAVSSGAVLVLFTPEKGNNPESWDS